jgi:signal transduction histidine kinase
MGRAIPPSAEQLRRYKLLARVSRAINSSLQPRRVLNRVLGEAVRIMRATSGSIALIDPHTQLLEIEVAIGLSRRAQKLKLAIGRGVTGWVAKTGQPLRVGDVTRDPRYVPLRAGIRSELAVPLIVEDALIGVLNVDSARRDAFSAADEQLLVALANQAAQVIHNSWLYEAVAHGARQFEALFSVARSIIASLDLPEILDRVTHNACHLIQTQVGSLMLLNSRTGALELRACHGASRDYTGRPPLSVDDTLVGSVIKRRKPLQVHDVRSHDAYRHIELARKEGLVSLLSVPLLVGDTAIGALNVYTDKPYRYSNQDIKTLSALAGLAAIAIENARLHRNIVQIEEQLRHNERLSTLGLLAAEIAHEIRNPLTVMKLLYHSLELKFPPDDPRARDAEIMDQKMDQLNRIVDQLLRVARPHEPSFAPVNINELIGDVLLLTRHTLTHKRVRLKKRLTDHLPPVRADRGQIEQVCLNLILNAVEAMPQGGVLTVSTALKTEPTPRVCLSFADTGVGMTRGAQDNLFQPFLTTKPRGTGLGLAIVQRIIETHRGEIRVKSAPKKGATFQILLPA